MNLIKIRIWACSFALLFWLDFGPSFLPRFWARSCTLLFASFWASSFAFLFLSFWARSSALLFASFLVSLFGLFCLVFGPALLPSFFVFFHSLICFVLSLILPAVITNRSSNTRVVVGGGFFCSPPR